MGDSASMVTLLQMAGRARRGGGKTIEEQQRTRLSELIAHARTSSSVYRDLYAALPGGVDDVSHLPVTSKSMLMERFDEWSMDPEITLERARAFLDDPRRIGDYFLGKYTLLTTSGTSGTRGIFVVDDRSMRVTNVIALRMLRSWLGPRALLRGVTKSGRMAMVMAKGGHFASAVAAARLRQRQPTRVRVLSVHEPLDQIVNALNGFDPAVMAPYASAASLLANEQLAGRLRVHPALIAVTAEGLPTAEYERIAEAFGARVGNSYAATECPFFSFSCEHWWLHVNTDWALFEPVDSQHRPVAPGTQSHTVLITNLANRVQPIIRYDLGDSVLVRPDPCPCGSPFPAIRVQGRSAEMVTFEHYGRSTTITPLAFATTIDSVSGVAQGQVVHVGPATLRLRLRTAPGADPVATSRDAQAAIADLLARHDVGHVRVEVADEPPVQADGGKFRTVIPLRGASK